MRAATAHDRPDWYEMPADVEKVAICRLSGARATDACRHQSDVYAVVHDGASPELVPVDAMFDQDDQKSVRTLAVGESPVYEDLFAIGSVPADICPIHNPPSAGLGTASSLMPTPSPVATSGTVTTATSDIVLERVLGPDGVMRTVMRQKR